MSYDVKQVIVVRKDLNMRKGKIAAQVAHASMKVLLDCMNVEEERYLDSDDHVTINRRTGNIIRSLNCGKGSYLNQWLEGAFAKIVVSCESEQELFDLCVIADKGGIPYAIITDSGATEFNNVPTVTCAAIGPYNSEELNKITGHLKLL